MSSMKVFTLQNTVQPDGTKVLETIGVVFGNSKQPSSFQLPNIPRQYSIVQYNHSGI